uniref:Nucleotidyltransferase domain-containing protein n=1 Tax=candidate division CPR3 bacterium TaxID=2268181 RepID=A0A7C4R549_UNCC3
MKITNLEQSILFTISYFDVFEYPLTSFEIWRYLFGFKSSLDQVILKLDELIVLGKIEMKNGFYFLPERSHLVDFRQKKYDISEKFWGKAVRATKILSYLSFIKCVSVVNSLSYFNCDSKSDIDFLIITKKNKIWTARFLSTAVLHLFGIRRHGKKISGRICLSFYISEEMKNMSYIAKDGLGFFVAFWIAQNAPILSYNQTFEKFRAANTWIYDFLPNSGHNITDYYINFKLPLGAKKISKLIEFFLKPDFIEKILKSIQSKRIKFSQKKWGEPNSVLFNDFILKFHPEDFRPGYKKEIKERLTKNKYI